MRSNTLTRVSNNPGAVQPRETATRGLRATNAPGRCLYGRIASVLEHPGGSGGARSGCEAHPASPRLGVRLGSHSELGL